MTFLIPYGGIFEESILATSLSTIRVAFHTPWIAYVDALVTADCYI